MSMPFVQPSASFGLLSSAQPIDDRQMSQLPTGGENSPWPPPEFDPVTYMMRIHDAWWVGDRQKLAWVYYNLLARCK